MKKHGLSRKPKFLEENYFRESKKLENGRGEAGRDTEMGSLVEQDMHFICSGSGFAALWFLILIGSQHYCHCHFLLFIAKYPLRAAFTMHALSPLERKEEEKGRGAGKSTCLHNAYPAPNIRIKAHVLIPLSSMLNPLPFMLCLRITVYHCNSLNE